MAPEDHYPHCSWPLNVISSTRDLDLSQCFEHAVLLPLPLVLATLIAVTRIAVISRRMRSGKTAWQHRMRGSKRLCTAKMVSQQCRCFV